MFRDGQPSWATPAAYTYRISAGNTQLIDLYVDALGVEAGIYTTTIAILSNDPHHNSVDVVWELQVTSVVLFPDTISQALAPNDKYEFAVTVVNMKPDDLLVFLNTSSAGDGWMDFSVTPMCIPSGSTSTYQVCGGCCCL